MLLSPLEMSKYLPLVFKNSLRNRRRTVLTVASLGVSFCLLCFLMAAYRVLFVETQPTPAQALRLYTHNRVSLAQPLPISYEERIRQVPGVGAASVWQWFGGVYKDARDPKNFFMRMGAEPAQIFQIMTELQMPDDQKLAFQRQRTGCIASLKLADKFGWKLGERITLQGDIFPVTLELQLVGIFDTPDPVEMLVFNKDYITEGLPAGNPQRDAVGAFLLRVDTPEDVPGVSRAVDAMFENSPFATVTETERAFQLSFVGFLGNLKLFLMALCGAVTFTVLLVSANTLSMAVRESIREIAILKTLGFTQRTILAIKLAEAALVAGAGGLLGCGLAAALCRGARGSAAGAQFLMGLSVTPELALATLAFAVALGLAGAAVPAWSASRTSILRSLRYTG
jgi:putative ABC transport system permease protein